MDPKQLLNDNDAVSPVIGVILMVAITVILAAVIATFVLGLGDSLSNTAPQASFDFNIDANTVIHSGGDELAADNVKVQGDGVTDCDASSGPYTAGDDLCDTNGDLSDDTIRVVWTSPQGGDSAIIGSYNA